MNPSLDPVTSWLVWLDISLLILLLLLHIYIYLYILSSVIYVLSKIVILHGLLESPNMRRLLVYCVLSIK